MFYLIVNYLSKELNSPRNHRPFIFNNHHPDRFRKIIEITTTPPPIKDTQIHRNSIHIIQCTMKMLNCIEILVSLLFTPNESDYVDDKKLNNFWCTDYGQQYTTVTQKPIQSTYRPSTVSTQPPPPRETYVKQEPVYEQRPVSSYDPEYDEALISQVIIDSDSAFDQ